MLHRARQPPGAAGGPASEEGRGSGEPRTGVGGGEGTLSPLPPRRPQRLTLGTGVKGQGHESSSPHLAHPASPEVLLELASFWKVGEWESEHGGRDWGSFATFLSAQGWGSDGGNSPRPPFLSINQSLALLNVESQVHVHSQVPGRDPTARKEKSDIAPALNQPPGVVVPRLHLWEGIQGLNTAPLHHPATSVAVVGCLV